MRFLSVVLVLAACGGNAASTPAPTPDPAPAPAPAPAPEAAPEVGEVGEVSKDADLSTMSEADQRAFLMKLGEKVYLTGDGGIACVTCHQAAGQGVPGAFPPLVGQKAHMGDCKNHAGLIVNGLQGEIEVDGVKYNGVMVPQGEVLNDLQIASVTSYVRQSWGNDYGYCSPADVAAAR